MRKITLLTVVLSAVLILVGCGSQSGEQEIKTLKKEIIGKKSEISGLKKEISDIEKKIEKLTKPEDRKDNRLLIAIQDLKPVRFAHFININGTLESVNSAFVSPEINGQIKKIYVKEGDKVSKGKLLIKLNSSTIESTIREVKTSLELAEIVYKRRKNLWDKKIGSEIQYLEAKTNRNALKRKLETLKTQLAMTQVKAPISGIVEKIVPKEGELAMPGQQLIQLINMEKLYVNADLSETYLSKINKNDWVELTFPSYPEMTLEQSVYLTGNSVNEKNRTFRIKVLINNIENRLKPNTIAQLRLMDFKSDSAIVIPSIIIKRDIRGDYVYVVEKDNGKLIAKKRYITIGLSQGKDTMVLKGLEFGEKVVVKGYNLAKNGLEVKLQGKVKPIAEKKTEQKIVN